MPKIGRNDPCPCGSAQKYKRCCLQKGQAERAALQADQTQELQALMHEAEELDAASNAVVDMIKAGKLDEAERAARDLLVRYPQVHDGHDRLGRVYEARGQYREAADCYREVINFVRARPDDHDPAIEASYLELIAQLDPPAGPR